MVSSEFKQALLLEHGGRSVIDGAPEIRQQLTVVTEARMRSLELNTESNLKPGKALQHSVEVALWPGRAHPSMRLVFPAQSSQRARPAMLVFRGGAYASSSGSGGGAAEWAAVHGMVGIEVEYGTRNTQESYPANYADAARAVRLVRQRAHEWGVDGERIGIMGFSAGGHLASLLSTRPNLAAPPQDDLAASVSARPNFLVLAYPLISFVEQYRPGAPASSVENFFGNSNAVPEAQRRYFSNELYVDATHPPVFIWTTQDDAVVPYTHTLLFASACRRANVPVRLALYPHGPHGMGLALNQSGDASHWTETLLGWLTEQGFIPPSKMKNK